MALPRPLQAAVLADNAYRLIFLAMGFIRAVKTPNLFSARAKLLVEKSTPNVMSFDTTSRFSGYDPAFMKTQPELLKSRIVMEIALENPAVKRLFIAPEKPVETKKTTSLGTDIKNTFLPRWAASQRVRPTPGSCSAEESTPRLKKNLP